MFNHRPCIRVDMAFQGEGAREFQTYCLKNYHLNFWKIVNKQTTDFLHCFYLWNTSLITEFSKSVMKVPLVFKTFLNTFLNIFL